MTVTFRDRGNSAGLLNKVVAALAVLTLHLLVLYACTRGVKGSVDGENCFVLGNFQPTWKSGYADRTVAETGGGKVDLPG